MIILFDYQEKALNLINEALKTRVAILIVMATGLGKTIVSAFWARDELKKKGKGLFLCHDNGILDQAMEEYQKVLGKSASLKAFYGSENERDYDVDDADMVFSSFQTMRKWKHAFFEDEFDFIIVDESHHGQAPTYKDVILYFKPKKLFGMTGTPDREDMKDIREIFGEEVVNFTLEEAIAKGWLTQVEYHILNDNLSHWKLKKIMRDMLEEGQRVSVKQINETIFIKKRDEEIARTIQKFSGSSKKAIIFCEKIEHAENFQPYLPNSITYHSGVKGGKEELRKRLTAFREGRIQYILAVDKFNEGIDIPDAEVICFLRCTDSKTIFLQQLGRGLRKIFGKEKVIVLDFVANCERLAMVKEIAQLIKEFVGNHFDLNKDKLHVNGSAFDFVFSDEQVDILTLIKRISEPFYEKWQEASQAAIRLGFSTQRTYQEGYKQDPKLPFNPQTFYDECPGWRRFLGRDDFYETWQEASKASIELGIKSSIEYKQTFKQDSGLPSNPNSFYPDFPGWNKFLDLFYETWQEASSTARNAGVTSELDYAKRYKQISPKLPAVPSSFYKDFPGWNEFLGKEERFYPTWQEAGVAALSLGINNSTEYRKEYKNDPKLPSNPNNTYKNFPGWEIFLGGEKRNFYSTWKEAGNAARALGIRTVSEYVRRHEEDPRLPGDFRFYTDFPGWRIFIGKGLLYKTWQEASKAAIKLGIKGVSFYQKEYKKDSRLPAYPNEIYPDFPGWPEFLGMTERNIYPTWQEASEATKKLGIKTSVEYSKKYKLDPNLPSRPFELYKDFPGFDVFLTGKKKPSLYSTWKEASEAALSMGISSKKEYLDRRSENLRLPSNPDQTYKDFPGWDVYLGHEKKAFYVTWQEAGKAAVSLGINSERDYVKKYRKDPRLPNQPYRFYRDFPGFRVFLGEERKEFYKTWQEAGEAARNIGIDSVTSYRKSFQKDPKLPSNPDKIYQDFPGYRKFLGKE